jgi:hypothetical protein
MTEVIDIDDPVFAEIGDLIVCVLVNDDKGVIIHDAAFQAQFLY